jgi:YD repeat-containing protein
MVKSLLIIRHFILGIILLLSIQELRSQTPSYPESPVDQSYIPPSPNSLGFQTYGNVPVTLFEGMPQISIPIYEVKCGSLSLPISLSYNYNGFYPLQDAGWVGLGWNLNAGGAITRTVEGGVDETQNAGYNYDQYNITTCLDYTKTNLNAFLANAYNNNLGFTGQSYDLAPDIFDAEFNGGSGKFFWYKGKAYQLSYNKHMGISWASPTANFIITTEDGTSYTFGAQENTTAYYFGGQDSTSITYPSAWLLTQVVSSDKKDTISLSYASYSWSQIQATYQTSYVLSNGAQADIGGDPVYFGVSPNIQSKILQSVTCRNIRVSFVPNTVLRSDVQGSYPSLKEIDVIDSLTGAIVKKSTFSYEYFGQTSTNPANYERLALKQYKSINLQNSTDSLSYTFKYIEEFANYPNKATTGIDYWGYYNAAPNSASILPPPGSRFYSPQTPVNAHFASGNSREPNVNDASWGALDTIIYPAGGYTAFQYEQNYYNSATGVASGPGICLKSTTDVSNNPNNPTAKIRNYTYLMDDGVTSSGVLTNIPDFSGPPLVTVTTDTTTTPDMYTVYGASNNAGGIGGINPEFYYQKVTETIQSGGETHKSDHYFTAYPGLFLDVRETKRIDYANTVNTNEFTPILKTMSTYNYNQDTTFEVATDFIDSEYIAVHGSPRVTFTYEDNRNAWGTYWVYPVSQQTTRYDVNGDSLVTTMIMTFNPTTRNLASVQTGTSDGQTLEQYFKYPEDYATSLTGNMVSARVLGPVMETQTWLKQNASDSVLITGSITQYDQSKYKPVAKYAIETTAPIAALNNQTVSEGLYTSLLSDSRYILKEQLQYDVNNNLDIATKSSDMNICYIWDYKHCLPIATVKNAALSDICYTSFEADGSGSWAVTGSRIFTGSAVTGNQSYSLSSGGIFRSGMNSLETYIVSYWSDSGSYSVTASSHITQGKTITINGVAWTYYEHTCVGTGGMAITGVGHIDELRMYTKGALMTTTTYSPLIGVTSKCDADNRVTYYQYDGFNRLKVVLDQDRNVIKTIQYHFQGEVVE